MSYLLDRSAPIASLRPPIPAPHRASAPTTAPTRRWCAGEAPGARALARPGAWARSSAGTGGSVAAPAARAAALRRHQGRSLPTRNRGDHPRCPVKRQRRVPVDYDDQDLLTTAPSGRTTSYPTARSSRSPGRSSAASSSPRAQQGGGDPPTATSSCIHSRRASRLHRPSEGRAQADAEAASCDKYETKARTLGSAGGGQDRAQVLGTGRRASRGGPVGGGQPPVVPRRAPQ
jgi:hypothetical protein